MDKDIIINGVDVSDCMYYEPKAIKMNCHEQTIAKPCGTFPICYYKLLHKAYKNCEHLEQENARLKEEIETRDNLIDHFRDEALYRATIANEYQKDKTKLKHTLQEIKEIAENEIKKLTDSAINGGRYLEILDLITKAEEE